MLRATTFALTVTTALAFASEACADTTIYTSREAFLDAAGETDFTDFETPFDPANPISFDSFSLTADPIRDPGFEPRVEDGQFITPDGQAAVLYRPFPQEGQTIVELEVRFCPPVTAFGTYFIDIGSIPDSGRFVYADGPGAPHTVVEWSSNRGINEVDFFGMVSDVPFDSVVFVHTADGFHGDAVAFDAVDLVPVCSDIDGDGQVAFSDILEVLVEWGPCGDCREDLDCDGEVSFADLLHLLGAWGPCGDGA